MTLKYCKWFVFVFLFLDGFFLLNVLKLSQEKKNIEQETSLVVSKINSTVSLIKRMQQMNIGDMNEVFFKSDQEFSLFLKNLVKKNQLEIRDEQYKKDNVLRLAVSGNGTKIISFMMDLDVVNKAVAITKTVVLSSSSGKSQQEDVQALFELNYHVVSDSK